jgi:hypothetical protein
MSDGEPRATLPTSTVEHYKRQEAADEATFQAPWVERYFATLKSSVKKWLGVK